MANFPKFTYDPEWPALEEYLRSIIDHEHEMPEVKPGRDLDTLVALLTQRDRQLEDHLGNLDSGMTLNGLSGAVDLLAGSNVTLTTLGQNITINAKSQNPRPYSCFVPGTLAAKTIQRFIVPNGATLSQIDAYFQTAPAGVSSSSCANLHVFGSGSGSVVLPLDSATPEWHLGTSGLTAVFAEQATNNQSNSFFLQNSELLAQVMTPTANGQVGHVSVSVYVPAAFGGGPSTGQFLRCGLGVVPVTGTPQPAFASIPWLTDTAGNPAFVDMDCAVLDATSQVLTFNLAAPVDIVSGQAFAIFLCETNTSRTDYANSGNACVGTSGGGVAAWSGNVTPGALLLSEPTLAWVVPGGGHSMFFILNGSAAGTVLTGNVQVDITLTGTPATPGADLNISLQM